MEDYKEFTGKSLDEAMAAACEYFGLERGKLEIEILSDAKTGIFGLVGAKRAAVRARKANIETVNLKAGSERQDGGKKGGQSAREKAPRPEPKEAPKESAPKEAAAPKETAPAESPAPKAEPEAQVPVKEAQPRPAKREPSGNREASGEREDRRRNGRERGRGKDERPQRERSRPPRPQRPPRTDKPAPQPEGSEEKFPEVPLESMDQARLEAEVLGAVDSMVRHIVGETGKEFEVSGGKARVRIDSGEDSGLLIGRDGQTLSALQYLASCIVSRRMGASVRVQIDAGDYRSRQIDKLKSTALELADKVRESGRPQSTRPMSAYLRRMVHMALADDPDVQTHSKGEGSLKRVVIVAKRK